MAQVLRLVVRAQTALRGSGPLVGPPTHAMSLCLSRGTHLNAHGRSCRLQVEGKPGEVQGQVARHAGLTMLVSTEQRRHGLHTGLMSTCPGATISVTFARQLRSVPLRSKPAVKFTLPVQSSQLSRQ